MNMSDYTYCVSKCDDLLDVSSGVDLAGGIGTLSCQLGEPFDLERETVLVNNVPVELAHLYFMLEENMDKPRIV
jgi:hypothetical protein